MSAERLAELQEEQMEALRRASQLMPEEYQTMAPTELYQLALKKRGIRSILAEALRDSGYGDISKIARFQRVPSTEGGM